ncbi:MAG TPA: pyruvate, phosphate dikinase [Acidimicrobiales bacterium]
MPFAYDFDFAHDQPPRQLRSLLGGKGANLAEMTAVLNLPVPHGFTISTDACRAYMRDGWPDGLSEEVASHLELLEERMGRRLGDPVDPLLVSVRSGAEISMPGMMDTVLNLGLNDSSVEGLAKQTGDERFALDSYRRFIQMYARIVLELPGDGFDEALANARGRSGVLTDAEIPPAELHELIDAHKAIVEAGIGRPFPSDPMDQLRGAIEAVFSSWNSPRANTYRVRERISHDLGTAVNVQAMVFGNRDENSGTGVGFTRDPSTGENTPYGDFLVNAQGEDVVAGIRATEPLRALGTRMPKIYEELLSIFAGLEKHFRDMCDTEFTIEQGKLWMLQTRTGKRTGSAALRMAVEMTEDPVIALTREEAVNRVSEEHVDSVLHPQFAGDEVTVWTRGLGASPGAAVGGVCFTAARAVELAAEGRDVILVRNETSPDDVDGMLAAQGVLTARGGLVSHAAVVARGWGKPAVVGADALVVTSTSCRVGDVELSEGDVVSIDGSAGTVVLGAVRLTQADPPAELSILLGWADEIRAGRLAVRANADNGPDAANARRLGAEGIGLCRTEHMFLADDRLPIMRRMILAEDEVAEDAALEELRVAQRDDFVEILEVMDGLPVTVRLLDPPLHEFLPDVEELAVKEASGTLSAEEAKLFSAAKTWREVNPMIGVRGVRLGVLKPGLYAMQVKALMQAVVIRKRAGGHPKVEVMIPLVVTSQELSLARSWALEAVAEVAADSPELDADVEIGTMIETPRAALRAKDIAEDAQFFSFGTNDLTQMTFGFSRDDIEARIMPTYLELGLLKANPFDTVDIDGVGELIRIATERGRMTNPSLKVGICGEHGGDPASIDFFARLGLNYVSCSPFRVPVARLAAAQALTKIDAERK